ncbi:SAC3_4 [Sanghuangporus weigelae]
MTGTPHPQPSSSPRIVEISEIPSPDHDTPSSSTSIANGKEPLSRRQETVTRAGDVFQPNSRSDEYKQRIHESSTNGSIGSTGSIPSSSSFTRQRSEPELDTEQPKRPRRSLRNVSNPEDVRTDEELAEKLMQNHEKNERRWVKGQFVKVIQEYVRSQVDEIPSDWGTRLCMNSSNDKTAIRFSKTADQ